MDRNGGYPWGRELMAGEHGKDGGSFVPLELYKSCTNVQVLPVNNNDN